MASYADIIYDDEMQIYLLQENGCGFRVEEYVKRVDDGRTDGRTDRSNLAVLFGMSIFRSVELGEQKGSNVATCHGRPAGQTDGR